ncbi:MULTISPECIES: HAD family hydrolase [Cyanophyceae]|uniref:HAD family hydrolase n=1 Tax=Cyanophyceae TaxID=3028117 RepID=UPI001689AE8A|nr:MULTISPECIES: HAD family hydrolase [Cyanophyceae]MBD1914881.1 HAD family hydrolase [Phormidium sp. FACHB-77]MBD2028559.1 HAD family hydrolase [Phormidium sp. FACHB-322]MBD2051797.1 HAD family hydrolase [Leptolyngbya sp. FACHB-60]
MDFHCQAIIFDVDGVLIDSDPVAERHWRAWANRHGIDYDAIARIHHGRPTIETIRQVAPHVDAAQEAHIKETAEADDTEGLTLYPGVKELLAQLPRDRWGVATSGTRRTVSLRFPHLSLPEPSVMVTADDVQRGKPAPDPYLLAAERMGVAPVDCLVIEDAPAGVASAKAAGAKVIAVTTTNRAGELGLADAIAPALASIQISINPQGLLVQMSGAV